MSRRRYGGPPPPGCFETGGCLNSIGKILVIPLAILAWIALFSSGEMQYLILAILFSIGALATLTGNWYWFSEK